jgi:hypothetical protein
MSATSPDTVSSGPNVILRGGPAALLPDQERIRYLKDPDSKFKLLRGNRWEHFEPTGHRDADSGRQLRVLVWTGYTCVAE